jgi:O-antigen ligase
VVIIALPYVWLSLQTPTLRRRLVLVLVGLGVLGGIYTAAYWNRSGSLAEPAQAVKSYFQPNERDAASNAYRDQENTNLRATIAHSPVIGIGFGKQMDVVVPMANLQEGWALQLYMPHNNMLWLWERMGFIGFAVFWAMIAASLILISASVRLGLRRLRAAIAAEQELVRGNPFENTMRGRRRRLSSADRVYARRLRLARLRAQECAEFLILAFLVLATLGALVVLSSVDQGLMSFRLMAYAGAVLGALAAGWQMYQDRARRLPGEAGAVRGEQEEPSRVQRRRVRFVS